MVFNVLVAIGFLWAGTLLLIFSSRYRLLKSTWNEPYFAFPVVVIESDDWGPGDEEHIQSLHALLTVLGRHTDSNGRPAVLTANLILAVPDSEKTAGDCYRKLFLKNLLDHYQPMLKFMKKMKNKGVFHPQLHGLIHCCPEKIIRLAEKADPAVRNWIDQLPNQWEQLPHPLQAHYVNGTVLPSESLDYQFQQHIVKSAVSLFNKAFEFDCKSTVAPCYLWDDTTEKIWSEFGFQYIQTAGYRCTGLDAKAQYIQDRPIIRPGDRNSFGQMYLVRTVMFEPKDATDAELISMQQICKAVKQGLPVVISTHRYNYVGIGSCPALALKSLDRILNFLIERYKTVSFLNSEELGLLMKTKIELNKDPLPFRLYGFLHRIWYRHKKIRILSIFSLLILPGFTLVLLSKCFQKLQICQS